MIRPPDYEPGNGSTLKGQAIGDAHPGELLLPPIERLLRDAHLPADIPDGIAALGLPQRKRNLLFTESTLLNLPNFQTEAGLSQKSSPYEWSRIQVCARVKSSGQA